MLSYQLKLEYKDTRAVNLFFRTLFNKSYGKFDTWAFIGS